MPRRPSAGLSSCGMRQIGDRLVAAGVERADHDRAAGERVDDPLVFARPARPHRARSGGRGTGTPCAAGRSLRRHARPRSAPRPPSRCSRRLRCARRRAVTRRHLRCRALGGFARSALSELTLGRGDLRRAADRPAGGPARRRARARARPRSSRIAGPSPTSIGLPIAAARIATWEVAPPRAVHDAGDARARRAR